jgi:hypothetical protein
LTVRLACFVKKSKIFVRPKTVHCSAQTYSKYELLASGSRAVGANST